MMMMMMTMIWVSMTMIYHRNEILTRWIIGLGEGSNPLEGFDVRPSADDENMMELADDSVQGFFDHRGKKWNMA